MADRRVAGSRDTLPALVVVLPMTVSEPETRGELELLSMMEQSGAITPTGLRLLDENMTLEELEAIGRWLGRVRTITNFALGDWWNFGEAVHGEAFAQVMEATGVSYDTMNRYARVCRSIVPSRRRADLTFTHHMEVAPLDPQQQEFWLTRSAAESLSSGDLRRMLRESREIEGGDGVDSESEHPVVEPLQAAARMVWDSAHRDGAEWRVPGDAMVRLGAALGEDR